MTERSPFGTARTRSSRGPLQLLWVVALGFVLTHEVSTKST
ncbi:hypothetical protein OG897_31230 [Streptomyces sp. NBC_00237]|nr:hypothetical protein [Streptomyces sp. NBC_00237]